MIILRMRLKMKRPLKKNQSFEAPDVAEAPAGKKVWMTKGPTCCLNNVGLKKLNRETVILNEFNKPIGLVPEISKFGTSIEILAKNHLVMSLEHKSWCKVPELVKDEIWELIQILESGKDYVLKTAGASWRSYKSRLKAKHYEDGLSKDQLLARRPTKLLPADQWEKLVNYWLDEKT